MPRVRALHYPAFLQGGEAFRALWTRRHFAVPPRSMHCHPGFEGVIGLLRIRKDRDETRKVVRRDMAEQDRGRHPIIETSTGD